eukprot:CAMPEP_0168540816 /NCGR_PEP_ID=MMETSP0413-20121227/481_1 /TAXON_ID=136452 /ORGANISM="Filamoeba nolandi, Strain NC-AS-23-1" /LENGTH=228 /DNA_ID=CAMNT_0008570581 /DNA_START=245 /DNA_END=932 /DNA_ORIENTATION=+
MDFIPSSGGLQLSVPNFIHPNRDFTFEGWFYPRRGGSTALDLPWALRSDHTVLRVCIGSAERPTNTLPTFWNHSSPQVIFSTKALPLRRWSHFAAVYSHNKPGLLFFLNGEAAGSYPGWKPATCDNLACGCTWEKTDIGADWIGRYFQGFIYDFRIWSCIRDGVDISAWYNKPLSPEQCNHPQLEAYWKIDQVHGTTFLDSSPNHHDMSYAGTLTYDRLKIPHQQPNE